MHIRIQRELGNNQKASVHSRKVQVRFAVFIVKDPQPDHLRNHFISDCFGIFI